MGKRGPKSRPSAQQKLEGTYRADRRRGEPESPPGEPSPPAWLDAKARKYWRQIGPRLIEARLLTVLDETALALLCRAIADYLEAGEILEAACKRDPDVDGPPPPKFVSITDKGNIIQHPAVGVRNRAWDQVVKLLREFGMTPSARAGLHLPPADNAPDPMAELLEKLVSRRKEQST